MDVACVKLFYLKQTSLNEKWISDFKWRVILCVFFLFKENSTQLHCKRIVTFKISYIFSLVVWMWCAHRLIMYFTANNLHWKIQPKPFSFCSFYFYFLLEGKGSKKKLPKEFIESIFILILFDCIDFPLIFSFHFNQIKTI